MTKFPTPLLGKNLCNFEDFPLAKNKLLTSPLELAAYKSAITEAMFKGTARNIESEDGEPKNAEVG